MEIPSPSAATRRAIVVSGLPGIGPAKLHEMKSALAAARDDQDAAEIARPYASKEAAADKGMYQANWALAQRAADFAIRECGLVRARVLSVLDVDAFPACMIGIPEAPFFLSYRGADEIVLRGGLLDRWNGVAVIGTRDVTSEGADNAKWLVGVLARERPETVIVSGLAIGVDVIGHRSALANGLRTVAFTATDLRSTNPWAHRDDAADIVQSGGALVTEYLPDEQDTRFGFAGRLVARDRLQSAASRAVVAVQCGVQSGTMHAMRAAALQNRAMYAMRFKKPELSPGSEALIAGTAVAGKDKHAQPVGKSALPLTSRADASALAALLGTYPKGGVSTKKSPLDEPTSQQTIF